MALTQVQGGMILASGQSIPKAALPTGSVLQVVQSSTMSSIGTTSTSFVTTGFSASITPTSSSSKVLVILLGGGAYTGGSGNKCWITIYRGATNIGDATYGLANYYSSASAIIAPNSVCVLDSPATTSSTTYTPYFRSSSSTQVDFSAGDRGNVTLTLMEIAA